MVTPPRPRRNVRRASSGRAIAAIRATRVGITVRSFEAQLGVMSSAGLRSTRSASVRHLGRLELEAHPVLQPDRAEHGPVLRDAPAARLQLEARAVGASLAANLEGERGISAGQRERALDREALAARGGAPGEERGGVALGVEDTPRSWPAPRRRGDRRRSARAGRRPPRPGRCSGAPAAGTRRARPPRPASAAGSSSSSWRSCAARASNPSLNVNTVNLPRACRMHPR